MADNPTCSPHSDHDEPPRAGQLSVVPSELVLDILERTDAKDIISCHMTCHYLHDLVTNDMTLQYIITLFACGMKDNTDNTNPLPIEECLKLLQKYDDAWRNLHWTDASVVTVQVPARRIPQLCHGIIAVTDWEISHYRLEVIRLGSKLRGVNGRRWKSTVNLPNVIIVSYDPTQDLLTAFQMERIDVLGSYTRRANFLALSDGNPHPAAYQPSVQIAKDTVYFNINRNFMFTNEDKFRGGRPTTTLYDWKTGESMTEPLDVQVEYCLVDRQLVLNVLIKGNTMVLSEISLTTSRRPLVTFGLPVDKMYTIQTGYRGSIIDSQTGPFCPGVFILDSKDRLVLIWVAFCTGQHAGIFVSLEDLERFIACDRSSDENVKGIPNEARFVPWEEWGCLYAFPTLSALDFQHESCMYGLRRVDPNPTRRTDGASILSVYDYHPCRVARAQYLATLDVDASAIRKWMIKRDGCLPDGTMVTTRPYIVTEMELPSELQHLNPGNIEISMSEDGIMLQIFPEGEANMEAGSRDIYVRTI